MAWVLLVALGQMADMLTFRRALSVVGPTAESNPLMQMLATSYGLAGVMTLKLVCLAAAVALALRLRLHTRLLLWVAALGFFGALTNMLAW